MTETTGEVTGAARECDHQDPRDWLVGFVCQHYDAEEDTREYFPLDEDHEDDAFVMRAGIAAAYLRDHYHNVRTMARFIAAMDPKVREVLLQDVSEMVKAEGGAS
jgi:hypothetical protein